MASGGSSSSNSARQTVRTFAFCLFLLALCLAVGCGRKTTPRAPELVVPETIRTLRAEQAAEGVVLSWRRPQDYADGSRMTDLAGFRIERSADGAPFTAIAEIALSDRERFRKMRRFRYVDARTLPGHHYQYRVFSSTTDAYVSAPSNVAELTAAPLDAGQTEQ